MHDMAGTEFTLWVHGQRIPLDRSDAAEIVSKLRCALEYKPDLRKAVEHAYQIREARSHENR
jgi:hypothetical protein